MLVTTFLKLMKKNNPQKETQITGKIEIISKNYDELSIETIRLVKDLIIRSTEDLILWRERENWRLKRKYFKLWKAKTDRIVAERKALDLAEQQAKEKFEQKIKWSVVGTALIVVSLLVLDAWKIKKFWGHKLWSWFLGWFYKPLDEEDWGWPE